MVAVVAAAVVLGAGLLVLGAEGLSALIVVLLVTLILVVTLLLEHVLQAAGLLSIWTSWCRHIVNIFLLPSGLIADKSAVVVSAA